MFFDLWSDPQERYNLTNVRFVFDFMFHVLVKIGIEYTLSTVEYPNIKLGTGNDFGGYHGVKHLADEAKRRTDWPINPKRPWATRPSLPRKRVVKHPFLRNRVDYGQCTG